MRLWACLAAASAARKLAPVLALNMMVVVGLTVYLSMAHLLVVMYGQLWLALAACHSSLAGSDQQVIVVPSCCA